MVKGIELRILKQTVLAIGNEEWDAHRISTNNCRADIYFKIGFRVNGEIMASKWDPIFFIKINYFYLYNIIIFFKSD